MGSVKKALAVFSLVAALASNAATKPDLDTHIQKKHYTFQKEDHALENAIDGLIKNDLVFIKGRTQFRQSFKDLTSKIKTDFQFEPINSLLSPEIIVNYPNKNLLLRMSIKTNINGDFSLLHELKHVRYLNGAHETNVSAMLKYWVFEAGVRYLYKEIPAFEALVNLNLSEYFR